MGDGGKDEVRITSFCKVARAEEACNGDFTAFAINGERVGKRSLSRSSLTIYLKYGCIIARICIPNPAIELI
jgi:hypothetical protein